MSKDKYLSKFYSQMEAILFVILQIFIATQKLGNITWIYPGFSWVIFCHLMCLDQSHVIENIWFINRVIPQDRLWFWPSCSE